MLVIRSAQWTFERSLVTVSNLVTLQIVFSGKRLTTLWVIALEWLITGVTFNVAIEVPSVWKRFETNLAFENIIFLIRFLWLLDIFLSWFFFLETCKFKFFISTWVEPENSIVFFFWNKLVKSVFLWGMYRFTLTKLF